MIGIKIKKYRLSLKMTGAMLANIAGINQPYLSQIENEKKIPPFDTFMNLVDSIAKISPLTEKNADIILTESMFQEFYSLLNKDLYYDIETDEIVITFYMPNESYIEFKGFINKKNIEDVTVADCENVAREFFFNCYKGNDYEKSEYNLVGYENLNGDLPIYNFYELRQPLYEWWYNYILLDFTSDFEACENVSDEEKGIHSSLLSLRNQDGTFSPKSDEDTTNIPKELLNGKEVNFDLNDYNDKNLRLLLGGKMLSKSEKDILKVSIDAIKFNRNDS